MPRGKSSPKRPPASGGELQRQELAEADVAIVGPPGDVLASNEALEQFERDQPRKTALVKLSYLAGLGEVNAAAALGIPRATAARWRAFACRLDRAES